MLLNIMQMISENLLLTIASVQRMTDRCRDIQPNGLTPCHSIYRAADNWTCVAHASCDNEDIIGSATASAVRIRAQPVSWRM